MKLEISLLSAVIAAVIYGCGMFVLCLYIAHSLWLAMVETDLLAHALMMY